jgi:hypothetical protein
VRRRLGRGGLLLGAFGQRERERPLLADPRSAFVTEVEVIGKHLFALDQERFVAVVVDDLTDRFSLALTTSRLS